jgi:hypothetical protein
LTSLIVHQQVFLRKSSIVNGRVVFLGKPCAGGQREDEEMQRGEDEIGDAEGPRDSPRRASGMARWPCKPTPRRRGFAVAPLNEAGQFVRNGILSIAFAYPIRALSVIEIAAKDQEGVRTSSAVTEREKKSKRLERCAPQAWLLQKREPG